eukprot:CAMPEP_0177638304 /NCGR_PEP_ID=MMETSP0447-20121125/5416_1 /TAXON_ID=0 /ORGANISM="Stygamoeba regulata, Strain BSH-02190019" /LENGTH=133 /DNA_ID=CAMNT_0019140255 /DNA_START=183 /DNA_END=584 /DNA_ORIENTATION=+
MTSGELYPASPARQYIATAISFVQLAVIALCLGGHLLCQAIGIPSPDFLVAMQSNKVMWIILAIFLGNAISNAILSTGAFEVELDGRVVFSKLNSGRIPKSHDIVHALRQELGRMSNAEKPTAKLVGVTSMQE